MSIQTVPETRYYYDYHLTEEDLMGESDLHASLVRRLMLVLLRLFSGRRCYVAENLGIYRTPDAMEKPVAPDISVFTGVEVTEAERARLKSWSLVLPNRPPPALVMEIASDSTRDVDVSEKPGIYSRMGVKEYLFYDPRPEVSDPSRLLGWRTAHGRPAVLRPDEEGRLWSDVLESYLSTDGVRLQLTSRMGEPRLTDAEAAEQERDELLAKLKRAGIDPDTLG